MFVNKENESVMSSNSQSEQNSAGLVHQDQQSLFDAEDAFSESMVVEKQEVLIDSTPETASSETEEATVIFDAVEKEGDTAEFDAVSKGEADTVIMDESAGDTAIFNIAEKQEEEVDITADELQGSAKDYFKATHSESIENTVDELRKLAGDEFTDEDAAVIEERLSDFESIPDKKTLKKLEKQRKKAEKRRKKGYVSDDDMAMLTTAASEGPDKTLFEEVINSVNNDEGNIPEAEVNVEQAPEAEPSLVSEVFAQESDSVTYDNPLGEDIVRDEEDLLFSALGGKKDTHKTFDEAFGSEEPEVEYTSRDQEQSILSGLRSKVFSSLISMALTLVVTVLCVYFEAAAGTSAPHPSVFEPGKFGVTYALAMLQLMFFGVMFNLDGVKRAFLGMRPSKASSEGFCAMTVIVCTLHTILSCVFAPDSPDLKTYCSAGCVALMLLSVNSFIKAYTSLYAFCVAASQAPKISSFELDRSSLEVSAFEKYLDDDTSIITVSKGAFVDGFFKKNCAVPSAASGTFKRILIISLLAIGAGVACGILGENIYAGICAFTTVCLVSLPANALLSTALPFLIASSGAKKTQTAFIGEAAPDAYDSCGIISFDDTEVFPKRSVKVSSIRTYGQNRIDKVILYMARIFDKIEGPLSFVFANSVQNLDEQNMEAQIGEHFSDGISARVDGKEILVGTEGFMRLYDIETTADNIDESFIQSCGSIMYMSVNGTLAAKFYIKYTMNRGFEEVLHAFYDAGICVGIKTLDPCITTELICGNLKGSNYPVSVIKNHSRKDEPEIKDSTSGAVVSLSGVHNFLKSFIRLDNLRNIYRTNTIISLISTIIGIICGAVASIGGASALGISFIIVFQLLWCLPTVLISIFSK